MAFFKSALARLSHKPTPVVATDMSLDTWCHQSHTQSNRLIKTVEMCTALTSGEDAWGTPVDEHAHTLLQVSTVPTPDGPDGSDDTLLIERTLSTDGAYHSVTPISETLPKGGTLFHPNVHDHVCVISNGPSTALAHDLEVERTLAFGTGTGTSNSSRPLTLGQFSQILAFVSRTTALICAGGNCRFQSRSFAFTCLAALSPTLPPKIGGRVDMDVGSEGDMVDDPVLELGAEAFFGQIPWLVHDAASLEALRLIGGLKDEPQKKAPVRLYH